MLIVLLPMLMLLILLLMLVVLMKREESYIDIDCQIVRWIDRYRDRDKPITPPLI